MRGSRAASSTIIHAIVDAPRNPLLIQLTAGNEYDVIVVKTHSVKNNRLALDLNVCMQYNK